MRLVTIDTPCFRTPRLDMQACEAFTMTPTPRASRASFMASAIWAVSLSCTWSRREGIDHARNFRDADDAVPRQVADMYRTADRGHVVLAAGLEGDVAQDDDVVVSADLLEGPLEDLEGILLVAFEPLCIGPSHPSGRVNKPLPFGILAGPADQGADRLFRRIAAQAVSDLSLNLKLCQRAVHPVLQLAPSSPWMKLPRKGSRTGMGTCGTRRRPRIRVNAVGPGPTLASRRQADDAFARQGASVPLGRGPRPEEIADAVLFLARAKSVTGQMLAVDGGQHLAWKTPDVLAAAE
jgi:hypothetical protein